jgi:hypothetical protein
VVSLLHPCFQPYMSTASKSADRLLMPCITKIGYETSCIASPPPIFAEYVQLWTMIDAVQFDGSLGSSFPIKVCQVWAPSWCKFFVWLLLQNRISTADRLMSREWPNQYFCPLCYRNLETTDHLFIECPWSRRIWMDISRWTSSSCLQPHCWRASWE